MPKNPFKKKVQEPEVISPPSPSINTEPGNLRAFLQPARDESQHSSIGKHMFGMEKSSFWTKGSVTNAFVESVVQAWPQFVCGKYKNIDEHWKIDLENPIDQSRTPSRPELEVIDSHRLAGRQYDSYVKAVQGTLGAILQDTGHKRTEK